MPTYKNISDHVIFIKTLDGFDGCIQPGHIGKTYNFYSSDEYEEISQEPLYTPLHQKDTISGSIGDEESISIHENTYSIFIVNTGDGNIEIYNTINTVLLMYLESGKTWSWESQGKVKDIIIKFVTASSCDIYQFNEQLA